MSEFACSELVNTISGNPVRFAVWVDAIRPIADQLLEPLMKVYHDAHYDDRTLGRG